MKTILTVSAFALVLASACDHKSKSESLTVAQEPALNSLAEAPAAATAADNTDNKQEAPYQEKQKAGNGGAQQHQGPAPLQVKNWDKKIIKRAILEMEVKDFKTFGRQAYGIAGRYGGYIAEENQNTSDYKQESKMVMKVPVDQFDAAVTELSGNADKLLAKTISALDVTGEVVDMQARLEARRHARLRYLELMKQAKNMEEVFLVQKEIDEIQEQIEAAAGRVGYLSHSAAYSTIELTWFQVLNPSLKDNLQPSFGSRLSEAVGEGFRWLGDLLIALITLWPIWLAAAAIWFAFRKWRSGLKQKQTAVVVSDEK